MVSHLTVHFCVGIGLSRNFSKHYDIIALPKLHFSKVSNDFLDIEVPELRGGLHLEGSRRMETNVFVGLFLE